MLVGCWEVGRASSKRLVVGLFIRLCPCDVYMIAFHVILFKKLEIEFMETLKKYLIEFMESRL